MDGEKKRSSYSFLNNVRYMFGNMWRWNPRVTALAMLRAPFAVAVPLLGLYLSRTVVALVGANAEPGRVAVDIVALCTITTACVAILSYLDGQNMRMEYLNTNAYQYMFVEHVIAHDYEYNESPKGMTDATKASENFGFTVSGSRNAINTASSFVGNCIGLISYAAMLFTLSPLILTVITVTSILSYFLLKCVTAWSYKNKDFWLPLDRKKAYIDMASKDPGPAKDVRLYNMAGWLNAMFDGVLSGRMEWWRRELTYSFGIDMLCALLSLIREGAAYSLLVYMMFQKGMPVADFVLYFGVIAGFTAWFDGISTNLYWFDRIHIGFSEMREYFDHKNKNNSGPGAPVPKETFSIEFRDVGYRFAGSGEDFFYDFNLSIRKGERLAIVGLNGAGKTTLVKLMCGLYRPTSGAVLADGRPVDEYNIDEYQSLFSAVFQDITVLPISIRDNIACTQGGIDEQRFDEALRLSGFDQTVKKLPDGAETLLIRGLTPGAVDLSGGEMQKLALARSLYRDGRLLILDEPTAALDPIAESNIYRQYDSISSGKTSVFISHRLASTQFCDRIIYLENGQIAEDGSHDELMAKKGKYYELFEVQSHYYREGAVQ